jgi:hypothetical protein
MLQAMDAEFSGFLSLSAGQQNKSTAIYGDYDDEISFKTDSAVGLQSVSTLTEKFKVTLQLMSRGYSRDQYDDFKPQFEWAFMSYLLTPSWTLVLGRQRIPYYHLSEFLEVGYAYSWVRPPVATYPVALASVNNFDGASLLYSGQLHELDVSTQLSMGKFNKQTTASDFTLDISASQLIAFNLVISNDAFTARYGYVNVVFDINNKEFAALADYVRSFSSSSELFGRIADNIEVDDATSHYHSLGLMYENKPWMVNSELFATPTSDHGVPTLAGKYISIAYQANLLTPYLVVGTQKSYLSRQSRHLLEQSYIDVPYGSVVNLELIRDILNISTDIDAYETNYSLGIRYDIAENADVKLDATYFALERGSNGQLTNNSSSSAPKGVMLWSVAIDYIF